MSLKIHGLTAIAAISLVTCLFPESAKAIAIANFNSRISVNAFFDAALDPTDYEAFSNFDPPSFSETFTFGNAFASSSNSTTDSGDYDIDGNFSTFSETVLNINLSAGFPFGLAVGYGYSETGFSINLSNPGDVVFDFDPAITANVSTGADPFQFAFAGFEYDVRWNGKLINNFADNVALLSVNGQCLTPTCIYAKNDGFRISLPGVVGVNTFYIDPSFNLGNLAAVPGPLPILGIGSAFGFSRKIRKKIKLSANITR
jgi:hypothetical protein